VLVGCVFDTSPDTEDAAGWVPVPCPAGHENLDCTVPTMKTWELHRSSDGRMLSGMWEATPVSACLYLQHAAELDSEMQGGFPHAS
jgi:uncharacterized cupin superfamily protein